MTKEDTISTRGHKDTENNIIYQLIIDHLLFKCTFSETRSNTETFFNTETQRHKEERRKNKAKPRNRREDLQSEALLFTDF